MIYTKIVMDNKISTIAVYTAAVTVLLITAVTLTTLDQAAFAHKHHNNNHTDNNGKQTQSLAQANSSGNGALPLNIFSQNSASQVQGKDNIVSVSGHQP